MPASAAQPIPSEPELAAEQMREATERLRHKGWMVAPLTTSAVVTPERADVAADEIPADR